MIVTSVIQIRLAAWFEAEPAKAATEESSINTTANNFIPTPHRVDFDDFFFYRMDVLDVYYVGGFGVMGWVTALDYSQAQSDPLVEHKSDIMQHMNADHKDALILLAKRFAGIEAQEAEMTSVDRLGFHLRLKTDDGVKGTRVGFLREVSDPSQTREVFVEMVKQARQV